MILSKGGKTIRCHHVDCHLPPEPERHEIDGFHLPVDEQHWRRPTLPTFQAAQIDIFSDEDFGPTDELTWQQARREEIIKQTGFDPDILDKQGNPSLVDGVTANPNYVQKALEPFREEQLTKCFPFPRKPKPEFQEKYQDWNYFYPLPEEESEPSNYGHWFMNRGEPTWLTPFHYFYLSWWMLDTGYPTFRLWDRNGYYAWQYAWENPMEDGITEAAKRGSGKTYRATAAAYQATIYKKRAWTGIQSKTEDDAEELFMEKMVEPYKRLPDFFIPVNRNSSDPQSGLFFFPPIRRGKHAAAFKKLHKGALNSKIDHKNAKPKAYDGKTLLVLLRDEEGKVKDVSVNERHTVTRDCVYRDGKRRGKIYSTTTVDTQDDGGGEYKKIWDASDPNNRNEIGTTASGLIKIFTPADHSMNEDKYGYPDVAKNRKEINAKRLSYEQQGDQEGLLKYTLQNPLSEHELWYSEGSACPYNLTILRAQEKYVTMKENRTVRVGDFLPAGGKIGNPVTWIDNPKNGMWHVSQFLDQDSPNTSERKANNFVAYDRLGKTAYRPANTRFFAGGFDPTKDASKDPNKRRSHAGGAIRRKHSFWEPEMGNTFVADFLWKPDDPNEAWLQFIYGCMYFGCGFLPETNIQIPHLLLGLHGVEDFILTRPDDPTKRNDLGIPSNEKTNDYLLKAKKTDVQMYGHTYVHPRIIKTSIGYNPSQRTKNDLDVATQLGIVACEVEAEQELPPTNAEELFGLWDNSGTQSMMVS